MLEPEFIVPQDGAVKQDCERNAAQRWVKRNASHFAGQRHGHQHLSTIMVTLALLAFLCHTVLQLCDIRYQRLRAELGARRTFFR